MYGFCHGVLTCGSESVHDRNILVRRCEVQGVSNLLVLKMRPDTPQHYEYITVEQLTGKATRFLNINPWLQFYDLGDRKEIPLSYADHVTFRDCEMECAVYLHVTPKEDQYRLSDFTFEHMRIRTIDPGADYDVFQNVQYSDVQVELIEQ